MLVDDDGLAAAAAPFPLGPAVADLYADLRVTPLLDRLLVHSRGLLGTVAGSISLVDAPRGRYDKIAERGISCQLGRSFPLSEGATGEAVARRMPVVVDDYSDLRGGHLPPGHPASRGAAAAVPLWWRGEVIGVNVAFAGRRRRFTAAEVDAFELLTQSVAAAVVRGASTIPSLAGLLRDHGRVAAGETGVQTVVTEIGGVHPVPEAVATAAVDLVALVRRAAALRTRASRLHVAVVHRPRGLRLLVQDETADAVAPAADPLGLGTRTWNELLAVTGGGLGGEVGVEHVAGWGTLLRADFPDASPPPRPATPPAPSPMTPRENEVLRLLADGLSDREVAARLVISRKTVEKHVGAVLRKTGTASRTAAVVQALDQGWLAPGEAPDADAPRDRAAPP
jgi:DNA-binding CsgD family transcriptional regulator/GAF domain-containing protein